MSEYRIWQNGTIQDVQDGEPHSWASDDFMVVVAGNEVQALELVIQALELASQQIQVPDADADCWACGLKEAIGARLVSGEVTQASLSHARDWARWRLSRVDFRSNQGDM